MEKEIFIETQQFEVNLILQENLWHGDLKLLEKDLKRLAEAMTQFKKVILKLTDKFILNVNLCDENEITKLNSEHRGKNKKTDVLSFPLQEELRAGDFDSFHKTIELGDIFICSEVCLQQSEEFSLSFDQEFYHLLVHGFLHLCGYDHELSEEEEKLMESFEEEILLNFKNLRK